MGLLRILKADIDNIDNKSLKAIGWYRYWYWYQYSIL